MDEQPAPSIGKIATKYGLIEGVLSFVLFLVYALTGMTQNWVSTVISIALLVVLMVLAHGEFKKTHEGMMTYPQGLGSGTLLSIVASVVTSILVFVYVKFINTGYPATVLKQQQDALAARGITGAQADQAMAITSAMLTPVGMVVTALVSGVVLGFIVALIVSIFTRKGDPRAVV
jgi:hypothetical protein